MIRHIGGVKSCKQIDPSGALCIKWKEREPPGVENDNPPRNAGPNTNPNTQSSSQPSTQPSKQYKPPRVQSPLEPTHKGLDAESVMKAKLVEASKIAYESGFNEAQSYIDEQGLGHSIDTLLSDKDSLVLLGDDDRVRVAYRGTDLSNMTDVSADAAVAVGLEKTHPSFKNAEAQLAAAQRRYGGVDELIGFSLGGSKAVSLGSSRGIATTTYNPFLGAGQLAPTRGVRHTVWRTTEDFASVGVAAGGSFQVKSIHPHVDKLSPIESHSLTNFTQLSDRRPGITQELAEKVRTQGQRAGEFELLDEMSRSEDNFTRFLHKFNGKNGVDSDGVNLLGKRNNPDSKMVRYWKEAGKNFSPAEDAHIQRNPSSKGVLDATTPQERAAFLKKIDRTSHITKEHARLKTAAQALDAHTRPHVSAQNLLKRMAHPTTLGLGLGAGAVAGLALDPVLPDVAKAPVEGGFAGVLAEGAAARLAGRAITGASLVGVGGVAGVASAVAGVAVDAGVEATAHALGASDDVSSALGQTSGAAVAGAVGIGAAAGMASLAGAEVGAFAGPLGVAAGASVGAAIGLGGWLIGKLMH